MSATAPGKPPAALLAWADDRFGPLGRLRRLRLGAPDPPWWYCGAELARAPAGNWFSPEPVASAGAALDPDEALWRALGEGVERYCALNAAVAGEWATLREAGLADRWPVCAPDEPCPPSLRALPRDTPLTQVRARRLADDREALVPAGIAHLNFQPAPPEPPVAVPISTGLAFGRDLPTALWTGLREVAERDAIVGMWWTGSSPPEITGDVRDVPDALAERLELLAAAGLRARLFDIGTDFRVPTVFAVVTAERYPLLVVGAGCHTDPAAACAKALDETVALRCALRGRRDGADPAAPPAVRRLIDHALYYAGQAGHPAFTFLLDRRGARLSFAEFAGRDWWTTPPGLPALSRFAAARERDGLTVLWLDLTAPEAAGLGRVVKVIVPEMIPLSPDHAIRWLGTPRLLARVGLAAASVARFKPDPHPFP